MILGLGLISSLDLIFQPLTQSILQSRYEPYGNSIEFDRRVSAIASYFTLE